jgi:hypothetical protein
LPKPPERKHRNDLNLFYFVSWVKNYVGIIEALRAHRITPIVQSTLYVSPEKSTYKMINQRVNALNALLKTYAGEHGIVYLDINSVLATHGYLNPKHTCDGVHLLGRGYARWREFLLNHPVAKGFFALPAVAKCAKQLLGYKMKTEERSCLKSPPEGRYRESVGLGIKRFYSLKMSHWLISQRDIVGVF